MKKVLVLMLCALFLGGCITRSPNSWNDEDSVHLARSLAADLTDSAWLKDHALARDRSPALLLCPLENRSGHVASLTGLEDALARELLLSGKLRLVLPRQDASLPSDSLSTAPDSLALRESGADALLQGWLEVVPDPRLLIFQLTLRIVDPASGEILHQASRTSSKPLWRRLRDGA